MPYSGNPADSPADALRFYLQDTSGNAATQILNDGEVAWLLQKSGNDPLRGAIRGALALAAKYSYDTGGSKSVGPFSLTGEKAVEYFRDLAAALQAELGSSQAVIVYSGGISVADKLMNESDRDWSKPWFKRGMHDHPGGYPPSDPRDER